MRVQFRLRSLAIAILIVALTLALVVQTVRLQQFEARFQQAVAAERDARMMAELERVRAEQAATP